jgi:hypothetical protein
MPKKSFIILLILFPMVVGLACRFTSSPDPTATPAEKPAAVETQAVVATTEIAPTRRVVEVEPSPEPSSGLVVLEKSAWIKEGNMVFTGFLIENPVSDLLYENVEFTTRLFGPSGNLIDSSYSYVPWFYPNTTRGVAGSFYLADENVLVDSVDIVWTFSNASSPGGFSDPFTTENLIFWDNNGYPLVTGRIVNNASTTYTDLKVDIICYDSTGAVVGGGISYLDFIHLNDYMGFIAYVEAFDEVARVEAYPSATYSTRLIDKTDFLSEISIVDDYFYMDTFGYMQGGFILKNETDTALRTSLVYVTFYDENDNITTTSSLFINLLLPNDTMGFSPWVTTPPAEANVVRYDILILPGDPDPGYELTTNPFRVNSTTVTGDYNEYVRVNFTNTYSKQVSEVDVFVLLYNQAGNIIGGGNTWTTEPTAAGATDEIEVWVSYSSTETIFSAQAWVVSSSWSSFD